MKVLGEKSKRIDGKTFIVNLVEEIDEQELYIHTLGRNDSLWDIVHTDGKVKVISTYWSPRNQNLTVKFKIVSANWYIVYRPNMIEVYVLENYRKKIRTKNRKLNSILRWNYANAREEIIDGICHKEAEDFICSLMAEED